MAVSKSTSIFFLLALICLFSVSQSIPFAQTIRQVVGDADEPDDESLNPSIVPEISMEPSPESTGESNGMNIESPSPMVEESISPLATDEASNSSEGDDDDEVCVDASYLSSVPSHHLVHKESFASSVFCPKESTLPCGTANHMIRYEGKAMSYRQYCTIVECEQKDNVLVNSVLSHIWEEESHHDNKVQLTMYDIRHPQTLQSLLHRFISVKRRVV